MVTITLGLEYKPWLAAAGKADGYGNGEWGKEFVAVEAGHMIATNGHILAYVPCTTEGIQPGEQVLLPCDLLAEGSKLVKRASSVLMVTVDAARETAYVSTALKSLSGNLSKAWFPCWRRVAPKQMAAECLSPAFSYNPWLLTRLGEAIGCSKGLPAVLYAPETKGSAILFGESGAWGLIMPGRLDAFDLKARLASVYAAVAEDTVTSVVRELTREVPAL